MNRSIKHMIIACSVIGIFGTIGPVDCLNLFTTKVYAKTETYLKDIFLSDGYEIDFKDDQYSYIVDVDENLEEIVLRARPENDNYTVKINGQALQERDKYRGTIHLNPGKNKLEIEIKIGTVRKAMYTLYIYRGGKDAVYLDDIKINGINIGFNKKNSFYNVDLDDDTSVVQLSMLTEGDEYTVKVNDKALSKTNSIKIKFNGIGKYNINVTVIDNETERERLYTLGLYIGIPISPDVSGVIDEIKKPNQWLMVNGRWRYNDSSGAYLRSTWFYDSKYGKYFHFNKKGNMQTGWIFVNDKSYFLDVHGAMQTGWILDNGEWYYLKHDGSMQTEWGYIDGNWYHFSENGSMEKGWILDNNNWYYLDNVGAMKTRWILYKRKWYYLNPDGSMHTGWLDSGYNWYYLNSDGSMKSGEWLYYNGNWYCFDHPGNMIRRDVNNNKSGWLHVEQDNKFYYFNEDGTMNTTTKTIDGYTYNFNKDGSAIVD